LFGVFSFLTLLGVLATLAAWFWLSCIWRQVKHHCGALAWGQLYFSWQNRGIHGSKTGAKLVSEVWHKCEFWFYGDMTDLRMVPREWLYFAKLGEAQFCSSFPPVGPPEPQEETGAKLQFCSSFAFSVLSHFCSSFATVNTPNGALKTKKTTYTETK
jgi:hypothetical protein